MNEQPKTIWSLLMNGLDRTESNVLSSVKGQQGQQADPKTGRLSMLSILLLCMLTYLFSRLLYRGQDILYLLKKRRQFATLRGPNRHPVIKT